MGGHELPFCCFVYVIHKKGERPFCKEWCYEISSKGLVPFDNINITIRMCSLCGNYVNVLWSNDVLLLMHDEKIIDEVCAISYD